MPVIFTEEKYISHLVKAEFWPEHGYCREQVTVNVASETALTIGSVIAYDSVAEKYVPRDPAGINGTDVAVGVVIENITVPATTDTAVLALVDGPVLVAEQALVFDVAHDAAQTATAIAELKALGIKVRTQLY